MFCCEINEVSSSQKIDYQPTPLKLKIIQKLGLSSLVMDNLVFVRSPSSNIQVYSDYQSKLVEKQSKLFTDGSPYIAPYGYSYSYFVLNSQNNSVPVVYLKYQQEKANQTIVYSHGNASTLTQSLRFVTNIAQQHKADYIAYDYTGYGNSQFKQTTPSSICQDLQIILAHINKPLQEIVLVGFSLGCFPTAKVAAKHKVKAIILLAPMASLISLFQEKISAFTFFKDDQFNLLQAVQSIQSHIMIAHSRDDELIPFHHSQILYQRYVKISKNPSIELVQLRRMKHKQMQLYLYSTQQNTLKRKFFRFLKQAQERRIVEYYVYKRKKVQSQKQGKLSQQTKKLMKKQSMNRQKQHISYSNHQFSKLRKQIKLLKPQ